MTAPHADLPSPSSSVMDQAPGKDQALTPAPVLALDQRDAIAAAYQADGHVTVSGVFAPTVMMDALADITQWGEAFLAELPAADRRWYIDGGVRGAGVLRKLDNPHARRPFFSQLARDPVLVGLVESLIGGRGVAVYYSQIFFKPPGGGGPKPAHQDNYYFGPSDHDGVVTAWVALEDADLDNGCLHYGRASHLKPVLPHFAPEGEPFNLQMTAADLAAQEMRPAPVPQGGVSFHHGGTVHQSADNPSTRWRRACALHYVRHDVVFQSPALPYDHSLVLTVSEP